MASYTQRTDLYWVIAAIGSVIGLALSAPAALAQAPPGFGFDVDETPNAAMRLAIKNETLAPGEAEIAVVFELKEGWHLYWRNAGDTGLPPEVSFELPEGVTMAGELRWPGPDRYLHGGGQLLDYIYGGDFALLAPVRLDESLAGETVEIRASASWLVCKEACLPGEGEDALRVHVARSAGTPTADAPLIRASRERVPSGDARVSAEWDGRDLVVRAAGADRLEFFPLTPAGGPVGLKESGAADADLLRVTYDDSVHTADRVEAVVGVTRAGVTRFATVSLPGPRKAG